MLSLRPLDESLLLHSLGRADYTICLNNRMTRRLVADCLTELQGYTTVGACLQGEGAEGEMSGACAEQPAEAQAKAKKIEVWWHDIDQDGPVPVLLEQSALPSYAPVCTSLRLKSDSQSDIRYVASGGFADVFLGTNAQDGRSVIVKILKAGPRKKIRIASEQRVRRMLEHKFMHYSQSIGTREQLKQCISQLGEKEAALAEIVKQHATAEQQYVPDLVAQDICLVVRGCAEIKPGSPDVVLCGLTSREKTDLFCLDSQTGFSEEEFAAKYDELIPCEQTPPEELLQKLEKHFARSVLLDELKSMTSRGGNFRLPPRRKDLRNFLEGANLEGKKVLKQRFCGDSMSSKSADGAAGEEQQVSEWNGLRLGVAHLRQPRANDLFLAIQTNKWDTYDYAWFRLLPVKAGVREEDCFFAVGTRSKQTLDGKNKYTYTTLVNKAQAHKAVTRSDKVAPDKEKIRLHCDSRRFKAGKLGDLREAKLRPKVGRKKSEQDPFGRLELKSSLREHLAPALDSEGVDATVDAVVKLLNNGTMWDSLGDSPALVVQR